LAGTAGAQTSGELPAMRNTCTRRASLWFVSAVVLLLLGVFGTRSWAAPVSAATRYMGEAIGNVMRAARTVDRLSDFGYCPGTCVLGGYLAQGQSKDFETTLEPGTRHLILAGGDSDATDVDVEIIEKRTGRTVASDNTVGPWGIVFFTPSSNDFYVLRVRLYRTRTSGSYVAAAMLRAGGYTVPITSLTEAGTNLLAWCEFNMQQERAEGRAAGFISGTGSWALFGAILDSGDSTRVFNVRPGGGRRLFLAAGDDDAEDIDLVLDSNNASAVLRRDVEDDNLPMIVYSTGEQRSYGITTKLARSKQSRYCLVLTAVISSSSRS
jgi:hypothetical protein